MTDPNRSLRKVTTGDFSSGGLLNRQQFDEFFLEVQDQANVLDTLRFEPVEAHQLQIDKLGVGTQLLRAATEATSGTQQTPNTGSVDIDVTKVELPWEVSMETVEDTIEREGTADRLVDLFAQQFAVDLEDLAFNGDNSTGNFYSIDQGYIDLADNGSQSSDVNTYDHSSASIDKDVFKELIQALPARFKRDMSGLRFYASLDQKNAYKDYLTDRSTGAGDAMLLSGEEPTPFGVPIDTPVGFPDDRVMLTRPENLIYVVRRDVRMRSTQEGEAVVNRDLFAIYNMLARIDFQIEDGNGISIASNVASP